MFRTYGVALPDVHALLSLGRRVFIPSKSPYEFQGRLRQPSPYECAAYAEYATAAGARRPAIGGACGGIAPAGGGGRGRGLQGCVGASA